MAYGGPRGHGMNHTLDRRSAFCGACGSPVKDDTGTNDADRQPCPHCGSRSRKLDVGFDERMPFFEGTRIYQKRKRFGLVIDLFFGWAPWKTAGDVVRKFRLIDRSRKPDPSWYKEKVVTRTGVVLKDVDEPLKNHKGRGSDRKNRKSG